MAQSETSAGGIAASLGLPAKPTGLVLFAHGSGSSRHSPRNRFVADALNNVNIATLLLDLLTAEEDRVDRETAELRFDIGLLTRRLVSATQWARQNASFASLPFGYFGASTGAAAALAAAAGLPKEIAAVVSRGGRPDLAGADALSQVRAPTLLIVGGADRTVIELNRAAAAHLHAEHELTIVPNAGHLFEEPGALAEVARLASLWFAKYFAVS